MSEKVSLEELIYRVRDCYLLLANKFNEKQAVIQELERENKELKKVIEEAIQILREINSERLRELEGLK